MKTGTQGIPLNCSIIVPGWHSWNMLYWCMKVDKGFACTLQYHQTIIFNSVYQWSRTYALKPKSVLEIHISMIWRFKFTDLVNSKKTESLWKNDCRQKYLDKSLLSYKLLLWQCIVIYKKTSLWRLIPLYWNIPFLFLGM